MSDEDEQGGEIAPSFEEQIRHLRKSRASRGTLFDKTTEHNVAKKLNRELHTKTHKVAEEDLDRRLQQTLNREAESDMYAMFDSLTASLTGYKRRETRSFRAPAQDAQSGQGATVGAAAAASPTAAKPPVPPEDSTPNAAYKPAPNLVARATKQYQLMADGVQSAPMVSRQTESGQQAGSIRQAESSKQAPLPSTEEEMVLGKASQKDNQESVQSPAVDQELIVGRKNESHTNHPRQIRTFPSGEEREISAPGSQERPAARLSADHAIARAEYDQQGVQPDAFPAAAHEQHGAEPEAFREYEEANALSEQVAEHIPEPPAEIARQSQFEFNTEFIQEMAEFTAQTGLDLVANSATTMQILLTAGGATTQIHEVPLNDNGIEEARILASSLLNFYLVSLRDDFNIEFAHFGEVAVHQFGFNERNQLVPVKALFVRPPRLDELKAVHAALEYSWPASAQPDDHLPMRIVFVNDVLVQGEDFGARLKFGEDGRPLLFITPALCLSGVPTEKDTYDESTESWQLTIMRELSWKSLADCRKLPLAASDCDALGWVEVSKDANLYILRTAGGEYYYPNPDPDAPERAWLKVDRAGEYINIHNKKIANNSEIVFRSADQIAEIAEVRPVGLLFHSPEEELADALSRYRLGKNEKSKMLQLSPEVYRLAKQIDQSSINRWYVPTNTYAGLMRSPSGALVDHTQQNMDLLFEYEHENARSH